MYKTLYKFIFSKIDAELMHFMGVVFLKIFSFLYIKKRVLRYDFFGKKISSQIGIAAGFDKNAKALRSLFNLGFGFVEVGTVTPKAQYGNPKPRIFRVGEGAGIINRMGFPNDGSDLVLKRLKAFNKRKREGEIVGVNIGKNKEGTEADYLFLIEKFIEHADYITINVSSPNTPGLRDLQLEENLSNLLKEISIVRGNLLCKKPFFLKVSPDIMPEALAYIYNLLVLYKIEGVIISNTTLHRPNLPLKNIEEKGGLSGKFLKGKSLLLLKEFNRLNKKRLFVISVGGIETKDDVKERMENGANLVQIYTGFIFNGPSILK
jgi:dihydroorotate dehydrogenase